MALIGLVGAELVVLRQLFRKLCSSAGMVANLPAEQMQNRNKDTTELCVLDIYRTI